MAEQVAPQIGLAGLGAVGSTIAQRICAGFGDYRIGAVSVRREDRARAFLDEIDCDAPIVPVDEVAEHADIVVEALPAQLFRDLLEPALDRGRDVIVLSCGALLDNWDLIGRAEAGGGRIHVPSGAILGLDAVQAAAQGRIESVKMVTRKPTRGLVGAPHVLDSGVDLRSATEPVLLFEGTPREAIGGFPANLNVAVALGLAGIGPEETRLEVWADPMLNRNTHAVEVESDSARLEFSIENIPSDDNSKTGRITALSVLALLHKFRSPLRVGT